MTSQPSAVFRIVAEIRDLCNEAKIDERVHRGPEATYKPSFIVTILILKNLFGFDSERSFLRYLTMHHRDIFPALPEQSWFNRKARKLIAEERHIHALLLRKLKASKADIRIVDTMPVPVVKIHRAGKCTGFQRKTEVNFGYCASKDMYYYGEKLTLLVTPGGIPTEHFLTPANVHDLRALKENIDIVSGDIHRKTLVADKGRSGSEEPSGSMRYYDGELEAMLKEDHDTILIVPEKKRHQKRNTEEEKELLKKRGIIERINNQLQDHMNIDHTRAKSQGGLLSRIQSTILSFTFGFYFNLLSGTNPLMMKSILV